MKYRITTQLKPGILDNAGKATTKALESLGFSGVLDVKIGKTIELDCNPTDVEDIAKSQTNEVMENYLIEELS
mgnify:FL=1